MRTLQEIIRDTKEFACEDRKTSWYYLISSLVIFIFFFLCTLVDWNTRWDLWIAGSALRLFFSFLTGLMIVKLFIIYHDFKHESIFKHSLLAKMILNPFGIFILNPPSIWVRSHNYHHKSNSQIFSASIGSFPIMTVEDFQKASFLKRLSYRLARNPLTILFGYITIFLFGMCLRSFLKDPVKHYDSAIALIVHGLLIGVFYHFGRDVLLLSFIFPLFVACALGSYLFYIQHNFPDMKLKSREEWTFLFAALYSSSFMDVSPIVHWFTGNIGYHHVHHLNSHIPFYRLPDAMAKIPELQNPGRTSLRPRDIYSCLKLKLWDPKLGKMT